MNRAIQRKTSRRTMYRKRGGGYGMGAPLVTLPSGPGSDWTFAVKQPINQGFDDCAFPARPGQLFNAPNPPLAQVAMAGGSREAETTFVPGSAMRNQVAGGRRRRNTRKMRGGAVDSIEASHGYLANGWTQELKHGSSPATEWGVDTGLAQTVMVGGADSDLVMVARAIQAVGLASPGEKKDKIAELINVFKQIKDMDTLSNKHFLRAVNNKLIEAESAYPGDFTSDIEAVRAYFRSMNPNFDMIITSVDGGSRKQRGGAIDPIEAEHGYPPDGWETPSTHGGKMPTYGPQTGLAQTPMAGGKRKAGRRNRSMKGGGCGCSGSKMFGGARRTRRMRGGAAYGYAIDPSQSIGGAGPNVDAIRSPVPCDPRPGSIDPSNPQLPADPRAYGVGYSATPNTTLPSVQAGGAYSTGNAYPDSCYKAPGSSLPVYNAQTAGFNFYPSTAHNGALPDGVTPYNDVVPYAARMGGGRRRRGSRKGRKGKKGGRRH